MSATRKPAQHGKGVRAAAIRLQAGEGSCEGWLDDSPIAQAVLEALPITSRAQRWGDEIYFDVPVTMANTAPTTEVRVGDLAYWPEGPCLCIFFGKTPASHADEPRPASDVTVIGHVEEAPERLRAVREGTTIELTRSRRDEGSSQD